MNTTDLHVVIGAGALGQAVVRQLKNAGHRARLVSRSGTPAPGTDAEVVRADAARPEQVREACAGAAVVHLCAAPPYSRWPEEFPALVQGVIEGVPAEQARIVYADNLYAYGPVGKPMTEDLPHASNGRKGRTRAGLTESLLAAHREGRVRVAVARCSDFFGPGARDSAMGDRVFGAALAGRPAAVLGDLDAPHTQAYLDDVAAGMLVLGEREEALGEIWHLPAAETLTTRRFLELVYEEAGASSMSARTPPRWMVPVLALFNAQMREVKEVLHSYENPFVVDHAKFARTFPDTVVPTPHRTAIRETLRWYGDDTVAAPAGRA